jgi:hypothetical protein
VSSFEDRTPAQDRTPGAQDRTPGAQDRALGAVRAHPVRLRRVAAAVAVLVTVTFAVIAVLLGDTSSEGVSFGVGDQVAMVLLGLFIAAGIMLLARPSLVADERGLHVRNIFVSHDVPWEVVREVAFRDGSPWATLELADDDQLALLAVQASDGERSVATVRALRALHARHAGAGEGPPPDGRSHGVI